MSLLRDITGMAAASLDRLYPPRCVDCNREGHFLCSTCADSTPQFGDRRSYQMDPSNARMAMREIETDIAEGADIIMVKPAMAYLDVIRMAKDRFDYPLAAYNVSGEYSMIKAAARLGWIDEKNATMELVTAIKRAGADIILSYHAKEMAQWLKAAE